MDGGPKGRIGKGKRSSEAIFEAWKIYLAVSKQVKDHAFKARPEWTTPRFPLDVINTRIDYIMEEVTSWKALGLKDPFPSAPRKNAKYAIWIQGKSGGFVTKGLCELYAAHKLVDMVIGDNEYKWLSENKIQTEQGVMIKEDRLEEIIEYKPNATERKFEFDLHYQSSIKAPLEGRKQIIVTERAKEYDKEVERATKRKPQESRASRPDGLISIQTICAELKIDPKDARVILRKTKTPKPAHGRWEWPEKDVAKIKKLIGGKS